MIDLLCRLEENDKLLLTPFEKNIDIWRQFWRVLERSDLAYTACTLWSFVYPSISFTTIYVITMPAT
jgi:hypothetical protein